MELLTAEEKKKLEARLDELKGRRNAISRRIAEARKDGDLKENADYHAARDEQGLNEAEIRRLEERVSKAQVADTGSVPQDMVFMGSTVKLRDADDGSEDLYKIVGESSGTFDFESDVIEVTGNSPMGEALMKARIGETVKVDLPHGTKRYAIVEIV